MFWLLLFSIMDLVTGCLKSIYKGDKITSKKFLQGVIKKYAYIVVILVSKYIEIMFGINNLYSISYVLCTVYEIISNLENIEVIRPELHDTIELLKKHINDKRK